MAKALNLEVAEQIIPETNENTIVPIEALWRVPGKGKKFVDLQDDVTESDITLAHREGYVSVEHLKRYTTLGMGNRSRQNEQSQWPSHNGSREVRTN